MQTNSYYISEQVQKNEEKGRYIAENVLSDFLKNYQYSVTATPVDCYVDLKGTITTSKRNIDFQVEVKQRYKSEEQIMKYGSNVELRVDKYNRMLTESPNGTSLLYMVLLNESTVYLFNMKKLDWSKVTTFNWKIRQTQVDPNSPYLYYPTYKIPTTLAFAKLDCSKYFQQWN